MAKNNQFNTRSATNFLSDRLGINAHKDPYQLKYIESLIAPPSEIQAVFVDAPAGTGKTSIAISLAYQLLQLDMIDQIIYVRNTATIREIGFLPGDIAEKEAPYMQPGLDALSRIEKNNKKLVESLIISEKLLVTTTSFLRGVDWDDRKFVIIDEAQNMNIHELQMVLTRPHDKSKVVVIGSSLQCDEQSRMRYYHSIEEKSMTAFEVFAYHYTSMTDLNVVKLKLVNNYRGKFSLMADRIQETIDYIKSTPENERTGFIIEVENTDDEEAALWETIDNMYE